MVRFQKQWLPYVVGTVCVALVVLIEFLTILHYNNGIFVYTLDDPYIHLALAENISHGHYGINWGEFSAPSSSIIWPFILAPFANHAVYPFILNVIATIATIFVVTRVLQHSLKGKGSFIPYIQAAVVVLFAFTTNLIGLIFVGMEHSLQVLVTCVIAYGVIIEIEEGKVAPWLVASIIVAPLVRYECLAISIAALCYLTFNKRYREVIVTSLAIGVIISCFSGYLVLSGAGPFSTSIVAKSSVVENGGRLYAIVSNVKSGIFEQRQGSVLIFTAIALVSFCLLSKDVKKKRLALSTCLAISLHFIAGRFGWYHRYEIYIWAFAFSVLLYVWCPLIVNFVAREARHYSVLVVGSITFAIVFAGKPYIEALFTLPIASNNIYEQQYQMHRFAVEYYNSPVAVNDLGYVSYKNNNYVLDLWGLGSPKAFQYRSNNANNSWMRDICLESNVDVVMIYDSWFKHVPKEWIKMGLLHSRRRTVTLGGKDVSFYVTNQAVYQRVSEQLSRFVKTLPDGVEFTFEKAMK